MGFSFSLDKAQILSDLATYWDMLNPNGITAAIITLICGIAIVFIFKSLANEDEKDGDDD
jgi:hypothetical protein